MSYKQVLRLLRKYYQTLMMYRTAYKNFMSVLLEAYLNRYPINAYLRDGTNLKLKSHNEVYFIAELKQHHGYSYNIDTDTLSIQNDRSGVKKIKLNGGISRGDVLAVFIREEYRDLPVENKIVVDIGANIGDSSIYFALHDAKRVIGLEPFPMNFQAAKENVQVNGLSNKIIILLAACGGKRGSATINPNYESNIGSIVQESNEGIEIPVVTIEDIVREYGIDDGVLKMDCEGCEYDTILQATDECLRAFSHIHIEFHNGFSPLTEKLERCNFNVEVKPSFMAGQARAKVGQGIIFARRN